MKMKIGILSRNTNLYSTKRLVEAAKQLGVQVEVIDYLRCYMNIASKNPHVIYQGRKLKFDAIIPRIGATYTFYGTAVVRQFEMMGVTTTASSLALSRSRDKLRSLQILAQKGIDMPVTGFAHSTKDVDGLIEVAGGTPLVVKLLEGTQGIGVVLAETKTAAESVISAFRGLDANILVQEYIEESKGSDIRAFVVGEKVVAAMQRKAPPNEFRANLHRGGKASAVKLTRAERALALRAASVIGLKIAGVDLIRSKRGPLVIEVNSSPGLEGIEEVSGIDVAKEIIIWLADEYDEGKKRRVTA